mgnify:CR=1 FL=1
MRRRDEFINLLGGAAATWPVAARAEQPPPHVRRIGHVRSGTSALNACSAIAFDQGLNALGTGSAIVGPARADIVVGAGKEAGSVAGRVQHPGRFAMLLPRALDPSKAPPPPLPPVRPADAPKPPAAEPTASGTTP